MLFLVILRAYAKIHERLDMISGKIDRRRLCWLIDQYLFWGMTTQHFCSKYFVYFLKELNPDELTEDETRLFSELYVVTDYFSLYTDGDLVTARKEVRDKAIQVKVLLGKVWPCVYTDQSVTLQLTTHGRYRYVTATDSQIGVLGLLFSVDMGLNIPTVTHWVKDWLYERRVGIDDNEDVSLVGNITRVDRDGDFVIIHDLYPQDAQYLPLEMSAGQFFWLLHDWHEKVQLKQPQEVSIVSRNGIYTIETK